MHDYHRPFRNSTGNGGRFQFIDWLQFETHTSSLLNFGMAHYRESKAPVSQLMDELDECRKVS